MKWKDLLHALLCEIGVHLDWFKETVTDFREEYRHEKIRALAEETVKAAEKAGLIVTIERKPVGYAMRSHEPVIEVRERFLRPTDPDVEQGPDGKLVIKR